MAKGKAIAVTVNGEERALTVDSTGKEYFFKLDDQLIKTHTIGKMSLFGVNEDVLLSLHGEPYTLAIRGGKKRLAKDGVYIDNGQEYTPAKPYPKWGWIFFVANLALIVLGGAIPAAFGVAGGWICGSVLSRDMGVGKQVLLCVLITIAIWLAAIAASTAFLLLLQ